MTWLLLFALTALVVALPMWPAWREWRRPSDVVPLHIDSEDALDPPYLARAFAARLADAAAAGQAALDGIEIAAAPSSSAPGAAWAFSPAEQQARASARIWRAAGDAELPDGIAFVAEVVAGGDLVTAPGGACRALYAGGRLLLAPHANVLHWAHGREVEVAAGCMLPGRLSADISIDIAGPCGFGLLHAPVLRFAPAAVPPAPPLPARAQPAVWPPAVRWSTLARRATCESPLAVEAHRSWSGDLVCLDDLELGRGCLAYGSLKARGRLALGRGSHVTGSVVAGGRIELGAFSRVEGAVVSETAIVLGTGCVVGAPGRPATVAAPQIEVGPGVVVHGTLWAGRSGACTAGGGGARRPADAPVGRDARLAWPA